GLGDLGVGQAVEPALVGVGQLAVVEPQGVQERGLEVVDGHDGIDRLVAELIGGPVGMTRTEPAAGQPEREAVGAVGPAAGPPWVAWESGSRPNSPVQITIVSSSSPRCFRSRTNAALGWSVRAHSDLSVSAFLLCVSQGWVLRNSWTNRTPRSTRRRASRQRLPYSRVAGLSRPYIRRVAADSRARSSASGTAVCIAAAVSKLAIRASSSPSPGGRLRWAPFSSSGQ